MIPETFLRRAQDTADSIGKPRYVTFTGFGWRIDSSPPPGSDNLTWKITPKSA